MFHKWYIIESRDVDDLPIFEIRECVTWQEETIGPTIVDVMQGDSPVANAYKLEYAQEIIESHNSKYFKSV